MEGQMDETTRHGRRPSPSLRGNVLARQLAAWTLQMTHCGGVAGILAGFADTARVATGNMA